MSSVENFCMFLILKSKTVFSGQHITFLTANNQQRQPKSIDYAILLVAVATPDKWVTKPTFNSIDSDATLYC